MADVSLTNAGLKMGAGGGFITAWFLSHMNEIIGVMTIIYFAFQLIVIWPKVLSELKRHWFNFIGLFDRRQRP